ncbi:conserved hypothetical protein [Janthinobacterium agaricidamnosum NBRC 102515 = DSM 9628]|uniref:DUF418 domain-containing protein n=2 Tax=Janthinobacterium agaricidamnosum TaxID=55508 RepID=W0V222_9BURK|nr:conserved hypothetical protein [Janthinobacterium agaricidamnosum NBRC 102515 = DSM 9628]
MKVPTEKTERISSLDFLRGFALLGILALNIESFAGPESLHDIPVGLAKPAFVGWHAHLDLAIVTLKWLFFEAKMRGLFAMLFGAGVVLFCERLQRRGADAPVADLYLRRCMWLMLFGLIHGAMIWGGDILLQYALCGLIFLFPFRNLSAKRLILTGSFIWLVGGTLGVFNFVDGAGALKKGAQMEEIHHIVARGGVLNDEQKTMLKEEKDSAEGAAKKTEKRIQEATTGSYLEALPKHASGFFETISSIFFSGLVAEVIGAMLLGMGLYKAGFLTAKWRSRHYALVAAIGYSISMPIVLFGIWKLQADQFSILSAMKWMYFPYSVEQAFGTLANVSVLILLSRLALFQPLMNGLASIGRMAFSNYILTSLVCQTVFIWSSLKLYGQLEYYQYMYVVFLMWAINFVFSAIWLRVFNFGPLEWVWRSLTYWKRQPLFKKKTAPKEDQLAWLP